MLTVKDIAWLAGLLEGEGCFRLHKVSPVIQLHMTDRDIVVKARSIISPNSVISVFKRDGICKTVYSLNVYGSTAAGWMMTLYPLMGERRQAKIQESINAWKVSRRRTQKKVA